MADLTQGAVDSLLGLLTSAIKEEARLLGGVQGDIQFIKDEMDSMNGFLLHLKKTETEHNDQHRAWMKQVREIAYLAQDCIENYKRDYSAPSTGLRAKIVYTLTFPWTYGKHRDLANQLRELKERVREVGERRLRYGIAVPDANRKLEPAEKDSKAEEKKEEFLRALEEEEEAGDGASPSFRTAISLLPSGLPSEAGKEISEILEKCVPRHVDCMKMLLRALYAYPHGTKEELTYLKNKLEGRVDVHWEVMVFCYSKLSTHYKICLQYLSAFLEETGISRTILIRRWVAEGLVPGDQGPETLEEAGERCFDELQFRGFVRPATSVVPGLKIKSCCMEKSVKDFVFRIAESENFVAGALPTHFKYQLDIRRIAKTSMEQTPRQPPPRHRPWIICPRKPPQYDDMGRAKLLHPMDQMVDLLKSLPEGYRMNVLDLGGCRGLRNRHLKSVCSVVSLKYLSLRNTDVSHLPKELNKLRMLETLDVRQTNITTVNIDLPKLKHLLAGNVTDELPWMTVRMPDKIGLGPRMEILRHVQIIDGRADLEKVGSLNQLRKLGVVLSCREGDIKYFLRTITRLNENLRSLSVCIIPSPPKAGDASIVTLEDKEATGAASALSSPPKNLESLNIKYFKGSRTSGSLPHWIKGLNRLSKITLRDTQLARDSLGTLGNLESLCCLRLHCGSYTDDRINLRMGEFPKLRYLLIDQVPVTKLAFETGAAPKLEKIAWTFDKETIQITADTINGINNLPSLEELELNGRWYDEGDLVKQALAEHPKHPRLMSYGKVIPNSLILARSAAPTEKLFRFVDRIATFLKSIE